MHQAIEDKIKAQLAATTVEITDNSWMHAGHAANTGHHLVITIVSPQFEGLNLLARHRLVHQTLKAEMAQHIHALEIKAYSPSEWTAKV